MGLHDLQELLHTVYNKFAGTGVPGCERLVNDAQPRPLNVQPGTGTRFGRATTNTWSVMPNTRNQPPTLPRTAADVTADWLTQALRSSGLDVTVDTLQRRKLGEGVGLMSDVERMTVTYSQGDGPPTLIFKKPAENDVNRGVATTFDLYRREVLYYRDVAERSSARTPIVYYADIDGSDFALVLEDVSAYELGDQIVGCNVDQARAGMRWLARQHAAFWGRADDPALDFLPLVHPSYSSEGLMQGCAYGWGPMVEGFAEVVPADIADLKDRFLAVLPKIFEWMAEPPITVIHGDFRMDNLFFAAEDGHAALIAVDWQGSLRGRAAQDLGYFMSGSLPVELRQAHERELIDLWHDELCASGVTDYSADDAWLDYRRGTLFVWTHAVVISGTLDHTNERGKQWITEMLRRSVAAFEDLRLVELIEGLEAGAQG